MTISACHHPGHHSEELKAAADAVGWSVRHAARVVRRLTVEGPPPDPWADFQRFLLARSALVAERTLIEFLLTPVLQHGAPKIDPRTGQPVKPDVVGPWCFLPHDADRLFYPFGTAVGHEPHQAPPHADLRLRRDRISLQIAHLTWVGVLEPRQWTYEKVDAPLRGLGAFARRVAEAGSPVADVLDEHLRAAWVTLSS